MGKSSDLTPESRRKIRKDVSEHMRKAIRALKAAGDHGTAAQQQALLDRLDQRRDQDNKQAGLT
jgi:hypothetical protein